MKIEPDITIVNRIDHESLNRLLQEFQERVSNVYMVAKETEPGIVTITIEWPTFTGSPRATPETQTSWVRRFWKAIHNR